MKIEASIRYERNKKEEGIKRRKKNKSVISSPPQIALPIGQFCACDAYSR